MCRSVQETDGDTRAVERIVLDAPRASRGWQDRVHFARAVSRAFADGLRPRDHDIIHSHENTTVQDVSTEHGPCTLAGLRRAPWKFADYSALRNLLLERAKFSCPSLRALASCSASVEANVLGAYPALRGKVRVVIPPAFSSGESFPPKTDAGFTLGFIGGDWRRKGLPKALEIFRRLRSDDPRWTMLVAGNEPDRLPSHLVSTLPEGASIVGRVDARNFFGTIDVLLHPAFEEPFGMVVAEALDAGVPAVVSDRCGCVDHLSAEGLVVLPLEAELEEWARACVQSRGGRAQLRSRRTWSDVANDHELLYTELLAVCPR
jgi:UDP-glucose:(heptosyl)LPS alpha-1,3-glucosyltransferase